MWTGNDYGLHAYLWCSMVIVFRDGGGGNWNLKAITGHSICPELCITLWLHDYECLQWTVLLLQFFLELMKVPRMESKLRVFSFKIQFGSQVADLRKSLNIIDSSCNEVSWESVVLNFNFFQFWLLTWILLYQIRSSLKLKEIMKKILLLGNTLNQGTARGNKKFVYFVCFPVSRIVLIVMNRNRLK